MGLVCVPVILASNGCVCRSSSEGIVVDTRLKLLFAPKPWFSGEFWFLPASSMVACQRFSGWVWGTRPAHCQHSNNKVGFSKRCGARGSQQAWRCRGGNSRSWFGSRSQGFLEVTDRLQDALAHVWLHAAIAVVLRFALLRPGRPAHSRCWRGRRPAVDIMLHSLRMMSFVQAGTSPPKNRLHRMFRCILMPPPICPRQFSIFQVPAHCRLPTICGNCCSAGQLYVPVRKKGPKGCINMPRNRNC